MVTAGLLFAPVALSAEFHVDASGIEDPDINPGDGIVETASGFGSLRAAIEEANALPGPDVLYVQGTSCGVRFVYEPTITAPYVITDDLVIDTCLGLLPGELPLGSNFFTIASGARVVVKGLRVRGYPAPSNNPAPWEYWEEKGSSQGVKGLDVWPLRVFDVEPGAFLELIEVSVCLPMTLEGNIVRNQGGTVVVRDSIFYDEITEQASTMFLNLGGEMRVVNSYVDQSGPLSSRVFAVEEGSLTIDGIVLRRQRSGLPALEVNGGEALFRCGWFSVYLPGVQGSVGFIQVNAGRFAAHSMVFEGLGVPDGVIQTAAGTETTLINCTVGSDIGPALVVAPGAMLRLGNTVAAGSSSGDVTGGVTSLGHNFIGVSVDSSGWQASDRVGTGDTPLLAHYDANFVPLPCSPLIDAGDTALALTEDARCEAEGISGAVVDIGAREYLPPVGGEVAPASSHTADQNGDGSISLSELLRVIQFYAIGAFHCAADTEDGYAPGANPAAQACTRHSADYAPQDWSISLQELLRVVQLYNAGHYTPSEAGEDGFCPGVG